MKSSAAPRARSLASDFVRYRRRRKSTHGRCVLCRT
jgi:hypothetical protein